MTLQEEIDRFARLLRENPRLPTPGFPKTEITADDVRAYKQTLRAYDQARLELRLVTAKQLTEENSAVPAAKNPRILRYSLHV